MPWRDRPPSAKWISHPQTNTQAAGWIKGALGPSAAATLVLDRFEGVAVKSVLHFGGGRLRLNWDNWQLGWCCFLPLLAGGFMIFGMAHGDGASGWRIGMAHGMCAAHCLAPSCAGQCWVDQFSTGHCGVRMFDCFAKLPPLTGRTLTTHWHPAW